MEHGPNKKWYFVDMGLELGGRRGDVRRLLLKVKQSVTQVQPKPELVTNVWQWYAAGCAVGGGATGVHDKSVWQLEQQMCCGLSHLTAWRALMPALSCRRTTSDGNMYQSASHVSEQEWLYHKLRTYARIYKLFTLLMQPTSLQCSVGRCYDFIAKLRY